MQTPAVLQGMEYKGYYLNTTPRGVMVSLFGYDEFITPNVHRAQRAVDALLDLAEDDSRNDPPTQPPGGSRHLVLDLVL